MVMLGTQTLNFTTIGPYLIGYGRTQMMRTMAPQIIKLLGFLLHTSIFITTLLRTMRNPPLLLLTPTPLPNSEFVLDEKFQPNASKFAIFYTYENTTNF